MKEWSLIGVVFWEMARRSA